MPPETGAAGSGEGPFRAGFVALVGLPNVGKSTLLNRLVDARLSIVTRKAQTTRRRLAGIWSDERHQAVFHDTPGLLDPRYLLQEAMQEEARGAIADADVLVYVVDAGFEPSVDAARAFEPPSGVPALLCLNKVDRLAEEAAGALAAELAAGPWEEVRRTVAEEGRGVDALRADILALLPESPPLYPVDELAVEPVRFFVGELVREACFELLEEEVPYGTAVRVDEFRDRGPDRPVYIAATVFVERESQKGIVIGSGGRMVRRIGTRARKGIEEFLERKVYLDLRVKVLANWRKRRSQLKMLGFRSLPPKS